MTTTTTCHFHPTTKYYYISLFSLALSPFSLVLFFFIYKHIELDLYNCIFWKFWNRFMIHKHNYLPVLCFVGFYWNFYFNFLFDFRIFVVGCFFSSRKRKLKLNSPFVCLIESKQRYSLFYLFEGKNLSCTKLKRLIILFIERD